MTLNDKLAGTRVTEAGSMQPYQIREAIEKRLGFVANYCEMSKNPIQVDDSAYTAICEISRCSVGLTLELVKLAIQAAPKEQIKAQLQEQGQYVITGDYIRGLGYTYESLCEWWDNPLRGAIVVHKSSPYNK